MNMNEFINWVLNAKVKDVPVGLRLIIRSYRNYDLSLEFDHNTPEVEVQERDGWSYVKIENPDPEARVIDIVEDAIKLIEKYKTKTKTKKKRSEEA